MKINPFISTLPPMNSRTIEKTNKTTAMDIFVLTATVFSKLALLLPKRRKTVDRTRMTNNKIIFKLNIATENLIEVK
jgi:hypothetical protein